MEKIEVTVSTEYIEKLQKIIDVLKTPRENKDLNDEIENTISKILDSKDENIIVLYKELEDLVN